MAKAKKDAVSKETTETPTAAPSIVVNAQYIKDLSFENPLNPIALSQIKEQPKLDVALDIKVNTLEAQRYEVILHVSAKTIAEGKTLFLTEIAYAGLVTIRNMTGQNLESALLVYVPSLLFPFARRILADATREGSLPPLYLDPIDFAALYMQRRKQS